MSTFTYWMLRARLFSLSLFAPWIMIKQLREENERLIATISDPLLTGINIGNGSIDLGMEGAGPQLMAGMFLGMFERYPDAKNYIECKFSSSKGPVLVTIIRPNGKTPDQLRREAEAKLAQHLGESN